MPNVCILTDSTAQFTQPHFRGCERVYVISFHTQEGASQGSDDLTGDALAHSQLILPTLQEFLQFYDRLSHEYDSILVLTLSSRFIPLMECALSASIQFSNHATVEVTDSQTTSVGLGMLVQIAASAASEGASLTEIKQQLRVVIPRLYLLFCIPELTCLAHYGYMDRSQALIGEMMGLLPVFIAEGGCLVPLEKARTSRHLLEIFQDFVSEFESLEHIALVRGGNRSAVRALPLRQFVRSAFPGTLFSEHLIQPHLAALFGPESIGLVVMEALE